MTEQDRPTGNLHLTELDFPVPYLACGDKFAEGTPPIPGDYQRLQACIANSHLRNLEDASSIGSEFLKSVFDQIRIELIPQTGDPAKKNKMDLLIQDEDRNIDPFGDLSEQKGMITDDGSTSFKLHQRIETGKQIREKFNSSNGPNEVMPVMVELPCGEFIEGCDLIRGDEAKQIDDDKSEREQRKREEDAEYRPTPYGYPKWAERFMVRSGNKSNRDRVNDAAFDVLAQCFDPKKTETDKTELFADGVYFLYQGLQYNRGGDANIRTFLAVVAYKIFGHSVPLPQDVDLQAYVSAREHFKEFMLHFMQIRSNAANIKNKD